MSAKGLAVFDVDGTLIKGDSLWPYLILCVGWPKALAALFFALCAAWQTRATDFRTSFKTTLLQHSLRGVTVAEAEAAAMRLKQQLKWLEPQQHQLLAHHAAGHALIIASGGLALYLNYVLAELPKHHLIATEMESVDGKLTGRMLQGNCVRQIKADRLKEILSQMPYDGESWGYGNFPHDVAMLACVQHRILI